MAPFPRPQARFLATAGAARPVPSLFLFLSFFVKKERKENRKREERHQGGSNARPLGTPAADLICGANLAWKRLKLLGAYLTASANLPRLRARLRLRLPGGNTQGGRARPSCVASRGFQRGKREIPLWRFSLTGTAVSLFEKREMGVHPGTGAAGPGVPPAPSEKNRTPSNFLLTFGGLSFRINASQLEAD